MVLLLKSQNLSVLCKVIKKKMYRSLYLFKHPSDITDYSCFSPIFIVRSLDASHSCFSLRISAVPFISHTFISPSTWTYLKCHVCLHDCEDYCFTSQRGSAHVLWVNCVIIYVNYVHRSYTLPLGEMQMRTFCSLFVFKYIHFSLQGSGQTPCLFPHCSSFVFSCKYLSL